MKKLEKFDVVLNLWISLVINIILSMVLPLVAIGFLNAAIFFRGFAIAFIVSTAFVFVVPVVKWGQKFAAVFKVGPNTAPGHLLSTVVLTLIVGTLISMLMTAVNAGIGPHFVAAWLSCYGYALSTVYISALIGVWTGIPIAQKVCRVSTQPAKENQKA